MTKDPIIDIQVMLDRLESDITTIRMKMRGLHYEQLQEKKSYPEEPTTELIRFVGSINGKPYEYAALRVNVGVNVINHKWFTTGFTCPKHGYTWEGLVDLMRELKVDKYTHQGYHSRRFL